MRAAVCWAYFNPRTPVGCDGGVAAFLRHSAISIHAPQWGATGWNGVSKCIPTNFNPRTPVGCDVSVQQCASFGNDFNPRTPVGCDGLAIPFNATRLISIHAPQWGATGHARVRRRGRHDFNPRTPVGCDTNTITGKIDALMISIHAPQWGATGALRCDAGRPSENFNPRTPVGCDSNSHSNGSSSLGISIHAPQWGATP